MGRYILTRLSRARSSSEASSSTTVGVTDETYKTIGLPIPGEIRALSGHHSHLDMALYFLEDLLQAYSHIVDMHKIPIHSVRDFIGLTWGPIVPLT